MSDLVKRLRDPVMMRAWWDQYGMEAADRIEQLERAHARSQGAEADLAAMLIRAERAEAERDGWKERAESSEHNFGVLHDELAAMRAAPAAPNKEVE